MDLFRLIGYNRCEVRQICNQNIFSKKQTNMSMSQIARVLGFSSASYFSQSFRRAEGISPIEYRKTTKKS